MPRATLGGHIIHYQQIGRGPDLVLIHGLFCNIAFWWFRVAPKLAETHRVTALDLRGHGFSGMSERGYRAVDLAEDIKLLLDHLGIERAHLLGHSFGGAVAVAFAVRYPERVTKLTLADAWVPSVQGTPDLADSAAWPRLQARLRARGIHIEGDMPRVAQGFLEEMIESLPASGAGAAGLAGALGVMPAGPRRRPSHALRRWQALMERTSANADFRDPEGLDEVALGTVEPPVDLVYGARSRYLASRDGLARLLPRRRITTLQGVGHYFPILRPDALLGALEQTPAAAGDETKEQAPELDGTGADIA